MAISVTKTKKSKVDDDFAPVTAERIKELEKRAMEVLRNMERQRYVIGDDGVERVIVR